MSAVGYAAFPKSGRGGRPYAQVGATSLNAFGLHRQRDQATDSRSARADQARRRT